MLKFVAIEVGLRYYGKWRGSSFRGVGYGKQVVQLDERILAMRRFGSRWLELTVLALACLSAGAPGFAELVVDPVATDTCTPVVFCADETGDALVRRTDGFGAEWTGDDGEPVDLVRYRIGAWQPVDATNDLYDGQFSATGQFLCIKLVLAGLVNPPGPADFPFDPQRFGTRALYLWVELDMDDYVDTGGEIYNPEVRYLASAARFGGRPQGRLYDNRVSTNGFDSDGDYDTPPWIDRSGEEFHLALLGGEFECDGVTCQVDDENCLFEEGETWHIPGRFWHRAHGYEELSFAGVYEPEVELRFEHDVATDQTTITFVYPLTHAAYALAHSTDPAEEEDTHTYNAHSVYEGLLDLQRSALLGVAAGHPYEGLILDWALQDPAAYLDPLGWRSTILVGTVLPESPDLGGGVYTYTDIWPNVVAGDFNGDGLATNTDAQMALEFVALHDGDPLYDQGMLAGEIEIVNFGPRFSIYDVDYNGFVDGYDLTFSLQAPGDYNNDGAVDLEDVAGLQRCLAVELSDVDEAVRAGCLDGLDLDHDEDVDLADYELFVPLLTGPA